MPTFIIISTILIFGVILGLRKYPKMAQCFFKREPNFYEIGPFKEPKLPVVFTSQFKEDLFFYNNFLFSNGKPLLNGIFVEIGAMDGTKYSNTKFLEKSYGWYGILIEATPKMCKPLQNSGRDRSIKICSGICNQDHMNFSIHGIDSVNGMVDVNLKDSFKGYLKNVVQVKCNRFDSIFRKNNIKKIDFFSLDVEGAEYNTLLTFDWSIPVHYWIVEINIGNTNRNYTEKVKRMFADHHYKICPPYPNLHKLNICYYLPYFPRFE